MLRSMLNTARRWKLLDHDPFDGFSFPLPPQSVPVFLTRGDFQRLLNSIKENWLRELVTFAVLTGMRRGETINLRWEQVDLSNRLIHLQTSETFRTKQGKRRTIPVSDTAFYLLKARQGKSPSEFVFTLNDRPIFEGWVTHLFKRYVREAGLNGKLHFHSLRHTFATWLVQDGVSLYEVQKLLGHSSIAVTQVYSHLQPEQLHDTVNRLRVEMNWGGYG
jgi:integrase